MVKISSRILPHRIKVYGLVADTTRTDATATQTYQVKNNDKEIMCSIQAITDEDEEIDNRSVGAVYDCYLRYVDFINVGDKVIRQDNLKELWVTGVPNTDYAPNKIYSEIQLSETRND